jgi:hypothetical protein
MRKLLAFLFLCLPFMSFAQKDVTFIVDMRDYSGSYNGVYVNGTWNNWCGTCNPMSDPEGDSVWTVTLPLTADSVEYKFTLDGWTGQESLTSGTTCTKTTGIYTNRFAVLNGDTILPGVAWESCGPKSGQVYMTFQVNMEYTAVDSTGVYLAGGTGFGNPGTNQMYPIGDSVYSKTLPAASGFYSMFTFLSANDPTWGAKENIVGLSCAAGQYNDRDMVGYSSTSGLTSDFHYRTCFGQCSTDGSCTAPATANDVTFRVDMSNVTSSFTNVYVSGTLNGWSGNANQLTDADGDGVYEGTFALSAGSYEYKFTYDNWTGQESLDAVADANCTLTTGAFTNRFMTIGTADTTLPEVCWESCYSCAYVAPCTELFFSEYSEGSSNNKYFEIYNPTSATVSLSGYTVYLSGNGGSYTNTFTTNATIASGDVYMISTNQLDSATQALADTAMGYPSVAHFNGDDALILTNGTDTIDIIGVPGVDPGSSWAVGTGSTANYTLVRKHAVSGGSTDWTTGALEWEVYAQNTWSYAGAHASTCIVTPVDVTFQVDMNNVTASYTNVYVSGTVNNWSGNTNQLTDADGDGVYEGTLSLMPGSYEYKFTYDNWTGQETLDPVADATCTLTTGTFTNRYSTISNADTTLPVVCWEECTSCAPALPQVCGTINLELYDSYGDGWNGAEIDVKFTGGDSTYTLSSGSYVSIPLSVNYLDTANFVWAADGSYPSECTYKITDASGTVLYSSPTGSVMTVGTTQYTTYCATLPLPQVCGELFFSEYSEGSSNNKYIEIYNPTANAVSLSTYTVYQSGNGGSYTNTFTTNATIQSGDVYLIAANQADATILAAADTAMAYPSIAHFNGDDAMILVSGTDTIDVIGVPGVDPGSSWTVGTGSTANHTLVRKATVDMGSTDWTTGATEWDVYSQNTWTYKGAHTSNCIATQTDFVVTFMVNTANITVGTNGLYLGGGVIGGANAVQLADPDGDGIYVGTDTLNGANGGNFIFLNNPANASDWNAKENLTGLSCADPNNYNDRILPTFTQDTTLMFCFGTCSADTSCSVTATYPDVTFSVDMNNVSASFTNVYVSGTLNGWSGNANQLTDPDGDGVYDADISLAPGNYEFKFTYDNWVGQENLDPNTLDSNCTLTTGAFTNRYITVGVADTTLPVYCWEECVACAINIPTYTIDQIDNTDADGVPDSLNVYCKVIGVVHGVDMQGSSSAVSFTVHDGTEGLGTYSSVATVASYTVTEGDEVRIVGDIGHFNGLLQMYVDSVTVISTGNATQTPTVVTSLGESTESELVKFENMTMVDPTQWGSGSSGYNIDITNGTDTVVMRIDADVDLYGAVAPVGMFDVVGIGGQYDFSAPHFDGYQLLPRYQADIMPSTGGGSAVKLSISEIMSGSNSTAYNADWFEIHNYGDSAVDLGGFSWDDESEIPGTSTFPMVTVQPGQAIVVLDDVAANKDAFLTEWKLYAGSVTIVANDELTGSFPSLSQNGDAVFLYDANGAEMASGVYTAATAGFSVEFDTTGAFLGDAVDGTNGAYTSLEGDVGSPGNLTPNTGFGEAAVISSIFPNPTTGSFTVNLVSDVSYDATITNITGATVFQKVGTGAVLNIDLNAARGTYVLRVRTAQGTAVQMIVLQ